MKIQVRRAKPFLNREDYSILKKYTQTLTKISVSDKATDFDVALNKCSRYSIICDKGVNFKTHSKRVINTVKCPIFLHSLSSKYKLVALLNGTELYVVTNEE